MNMGKGEKNSVLSVDDLSDGDIHRLFLCARSIKEHSFKKEEGLKNAILMTAFFEPSTRTRLSFEMAALRLNMGVSFFDCSLSSMSKGESEDETITNLVALGPDFLVVRQDHPLSPKTFFGKTIVINAGDGIREHPTQALLDCFTLLEHFKTDTLIGRRILIVGDIAHSRVAHSNIKLMTRLGAKLILLAPPHFHCDVHEKNVEQRAHFFEIAEKIDAVMCLRPQRERFLKNMHFDEADFIGHFKLSMDRFHKLGDTCVVLHPGPVQLNVEISEEVAFHPRSLIMEQVKNGVIVRKALLHELFLKRDIA